jgi:hypothetical protein
MGSETPGFYLGSGIVPNFGLATDSAEKLFDFSHSFT